jgi:hypothetical protein
MRTTMKQQYFGFSGKVRKSWLSRRGLLRGTAGAVLGAGLLDPNWIRGSEAEILSEFDGCVGPKPIPGGVPALQPVWDLRTPQRPKSS